MMMLKMFMPVNLLSSYQKLLLNITLFQSMPKMPETEKKEESAESREEAKEEVSFDVLVPFWVHY